MHIGETEALYRNWSAGFWNYGSFGHDEFSKIAPPQEPIAGVPDVR